MKKRKEQDLPRPKPALRPVRIGVLPQMKAALDFLRRVELTQPEELDNFVVLAHAVATFYGWEDPPDTPEAVQRFLYRVCRKAGSPAGRCAGISEATQTVRGRLIDDLIKTTRAYLRMGFKDAGSRSLEGLFADFKSKKGTLPRRMAALKARWPVAGLVQVRTCHLRPVKAMVVEANRKGIWVNGMAVLGLENGRLPQKTEALEGLQTLLVAGAAFGANRQDDGNGGKQAGTRGSKKKTRTAGVHVRRYILRLSRDLPAGTASGLLRLAAEVGLTRVELRVRRAGPKDMLCLISVDVKRLPLRPRGPLLKVAGHKAEFSVSPTAPAKKFPLKPSCAKSLEAAVTGSEKPITVAFKKTDYETFVEVIQWISGRFGGKPVKVWIGYSLLEKEVFPTATDETAPPDPPAAGPARPSRRPPR